MSERKRCTAEDKIKILRELQEDGKPISQVAEEYGIHPNNIFKWRKLHLEMGVQGFKTKRDARKRRKKNRQCVTLTNFLKAW